jgi:hypothetical protein
VGTTPVEPELSGRGGFMEPNRFRKQFTDAADACALAQAIVDTVREPVLAFDKDSLQIIASIILMKARTVQSEETRLHLQDAHSRVMSIAAVHTSVTRGRSARSK